MSIQQEVCTEEPHTVWQRLGFTNGELTALARQGFVCGEQRGPNNKVFKLRFRLNGQQRVRYLGTNEEQAQSVQRQLLELQRSTHQHRQLRQVAREARQLLTQAKTNLRPLLTAVGFDFHGLSIRRKRPRI